MFSLPLGGLALLWSVAWAEQGRLRLSGWFINRRLRVTQVQHASAPWSSGGELLCLLTGDQKLVGMGAPVPAGRKAECCVLETEGLGFPGNPGDRDVWRR